MKQLFENLKTGKIELVEVPVPQAGSGKILVKNLFSLISSGTERSMLEFASKSLIGKARSRPDLVQQVLEKVRSEGLLTTYQKAMNKLEDLLPLGYSCVGEVVDFGRGVEEFRKGDLVACAGTNYANHAEFVLVPKNLCVKVPSNVSLEEASFVALGSIAMHGIRQSNATFGEFVAVIGLGLVGLLTIQILKAAGCKVIGMDVDQDKEKIATELGIDLFIDLLNDDVYQKVMNFTNGYGVDRVIMTASTESNSPVELTPQIIRDRGTLVIVGVSKIDIPRNLYYKKEIDVKFSRSYGPGRYDEIYEEKGVDYPIGFVRWTEKRNMEAFLSLISEQRINLKPLITYKFPLEKYQEAYDTITGKINKGVKPIAILFEYGEISEQKTIILFKKDYKKVSGRVGISIIGAGNFTKSTLLPNIVRLKDKIDLVGIASASGASAGVLAKKYRFAFATSDYREILSDEKTDLVFITLPHNLHAIVAIESLKRGKDVFVEKPLSINLDQLRDIVRVKKEVGNRLMVGFNRRFSSLTKWIKDLLNGQEPRMIIYRVNAGNIPREHWINNPVLGGGRIIGEVCHFVDFMIHMFNSYPINVYSKCARIDNQEFLSADNCSFIIYFENGAIGNIIYESVGPETVPKEKIEIFAEGFAGIIDNFVRGEVHKGNKILRKRLLLQDKGFLGEYREVIEAVNLGKDFPIHFEDFLYTTLTTFALQESAKSGYPTEIDIKLLEG